MAVARSQPTYCLRQGLLIFNNSISKTMFRFHRTSGCLDRFYQQKHFPSILVNGIVYAFSDKPFAALQLDFEIGAQVKNKMVLF